MARKLGRVVAYDEGDSFMMAQDPLTTWSREVTWQFNISYSEKTVTIKFSKIVTHDEEKSPIMSHDPLTTWSRDMVTTY